MENRVINIDPIDEALKLVYLDTTEESSNVNASTQLMSILNADYSSELSGENSSKLIDMLYGNLSVDSLGVLITNAVSKKGISSSELSTNTNLPLPVIEQLQADRMLANSVPIISFKKLLQYLQIPFNKAEEAINKTFQILKNELAISPATLGSLQLSYRRRRNADGISSFSIKASKSESQFLFQNEEALRKYVKRLSELCETK